MIPSPRWRKVIRDLWGNKTRTLLVILSITIGVAAIGMVAGTYSIIQNNLPASFAQVNPASARILTDPFDDSLIRVIKNISNVREAEGRFNLPVRLLVGSEWLDLWLFVIPDFSNIQIDRVWPESGAWPPGEEEILIERASLILSGAKVGDSILIQTPEGRERNLLVAGLVHDLNYPAGTFMNRVNGYISFAALKKLGYPSSYNQLLLTVSGDSPDTDFVKLVTAEVEEKIQKSGRRVYWSEIPEPGKHWFEPYLAPMSTVLGILGALILLLSGLLVVNTISGLLAQQVRQIGIMKAVGARTHQITLMYMGSLLFIGAVSVFIAIPLGSWGARASVSLLSGFINFDVLSYEIPAEIIQLQIVLGLCVPIIAALIPIISASRVTVRQAITDYGIGSAVFGTSFIDRLLGVIRGIPRPMLLSLRNTFRRKMRLTLTLAALTLGSAIFIAVISVQASLVWTLNEALAYYGFDVVVNFSRSYRVEQITSEVEKIPGITAAETWGVISSRLLNPAGSESNDVLLVAPPSDTKLIHPTITSGRWLLPEDENALVLNTDALRDNPWVKVGDEVTLRVEGKETVWRIVGITRSVMIGPWAFANQAYYSRAFGKTGVASAVYIATEKHDREFQAMMAQRLEEHFDLVGISVSSTQKVDDLRTSALLQFNVIVIFLIVMAAMLTIVGGLGLMGTMSLNVFERTREIGVMRAIGASTGSILQIFIGEGILIGIMSWFTGALTAIPLSRMLSDVIGMSFIQSPLHHVFSTNGALLWLGIVIVLAAVASLLPAFSATRLTVRDVLAYE